ncbi:MAG TPA: 3-octaprenyl-4-hydroxybenzoate carboxy-lyase [Chitinophagaceae bacterium]|nr:3-octaprenyl-4-hydroxybenzoate carboxy-lyase [Chitinophagaceae bacterium]
MGYTSLESCLEDLEKEGQLLRIREEVDPHLEMATIHLKVFSSAGPAILFENVKGSKFRCSSNIFGTLSRSKFIFRDALQTVQQLIALRQDPMAALKSPLKNVRTAWSALKALPLRNPIQKPLLHQQIRISDLPQIQHWPDDGGSFVTLPQVYTEDPSQPGIMKANLGMYRIQLSGNDYLQDQEIGLHYQLHRGIGVHQTKANAMNQALKVSCFVGGPPAHSVAAVMPLPEGISEMTFAGVLGQRRFRYTYQDGYALSTDADFVITGEVRPGEVKPEGPFGDHLGYYSLKHPFPLMRVHKVYARKNAIWPFTVVGRPPQEDTSFGQLIHEMTGQAIPNEIPGLREVHAVDAAGVHPLLLAIGSERYTPYLNLAQPAEILTIANHILGTGQLSLAKFLYIAADPNHQLHVHNIAAYLQYIFERMDTRRDIHFYTNTSIDTLDYSGTSINQGSKVVFAACGEPIRRLKMELPSILKHRGAVMVMPGVCALPMANFETYAKSAMEMDMLNQQCQAELASLQGIVQIVVCEDAAFTAASLNNYLWVTYTRCNPSHDIYGIQSFVDFKHWGCHGPVILDARKKPHHAPPLVMDASVERRAEEILQRAGYQF